MQIDREWYGQMTISEIADQIRVAARQLENGDAEGARDMLLLLIGRIDEISGIYE